MRRWKPDEERYLSEHASDGAAAIAGKLGRSVISVQVKASRMGLSLCRRWLCPRCGHYTYSELVKHTGWCLKCSIDESADTAAMKNKRIRMEIAEERRRIEESKKRRQAIYADSYRRKQELRRLREE